ncbi:uncharacterized protein Dvar_40560 [Desulfosarcina variabilis str. Montpellier]|uniref:sigma factor-like helix-turn-helix DNA-binding protein n=1 Tax=Desulfosarcina variabilis TaxID=2300 RepID=UPI003AFA347A
MDQIPELIKKIAEKQARIYWFQIYRFGHMALDVQDFCQAVYEKLWKDSLWSCTDHTLIYIVAKRACMNLSRNMFPGYRQKKLPPLVEYEQDACQIFDNHFYEIQSLEQLSARLDPTKRMIINCIREGHTLKEIGDMIAVTESRISQIRKEIVERLYHLYLKPSVPRRPAPPQPAKQAKIIPFEKSCRPSKRTCNEPGCNLPHYALGKCKKHYMRDYMRKYFAKKRRTANA